METFVTVIAGILIMIMGVGFMRNDYFTATKKQSATMRKKSKAPALHYRLARRARAGLFFFIFGIIIIMAALASL